MKTRLRNMTVVQNQDILSQIQKVFLELGCADLNVSAMWRYESCSNQNGMTTQLEKKRVNRSVTNNKQEFN